MANIIVDKESKIYYLTHCKELQIGKTKFKCVNSSILSPDTKDFLNAILEDENTVFVFGKGRKRYGYRYMLKTFVDRYHIKCLPKKLDETTLWHRRLKRAISCMNQSGLWESINVVFHNLLKMSWEEKKEIHRLYFQTIGKNITNQEFENMFRVFISKYPFLFYKSTDDTWCIDSNYIYEISDCKLKSMYFGKCSNTEIKNNIANSIKNGEDYYVKEHTSYDVSFSYQADKQSAWYSEEYRNRWNGHYYIALDHSTALFVEND